MIPFPPGMSPEEQRRCLEDTERKLQQWREERERSLEQALATMDVVTLADRWREEMANACERTHGPDFQDIEDMSRITLALATAAAAEGKSHESLSKLHVVLGEFNGSLRNSRHQFGLSQALAHLRQAAALEINALVIAHHAGLARNRTLTLDEPAAVHEANVPPAQADTESNAEGGVQAPHSTPPGAAPRPAGAEKPCEQPAPNDDLEFTAVEKAIVLLLRDGRNPRSMRDYAKEVAVAHTTLGRNESWQRAWDMAQELSKANPESLPSGSKDADGNLQAWTDERCENCLQEPITGTVIVNGETMRVCERCAQKLGSRTIPRTD